jgi:hypothetical protein
MGMKSPARDHPDVDDRWRMADGRKFRVLPSGISAIRHPPCGIRHPPSMVDPEGGIAIAAEAGPRG